MIRPPLTAVAWIALLSTAGVLAQIPQPLPRPRAQAPVGDADGVEVLARGPIHEGYASTAELPAAGEVVAKAPPDSIEELPPDQKPAGDNVQWIPGYWNWDEERADFIWISGFWRQPPPGRVWVPGTWREVRGGHQWVQGFWNATDPRQPQQPAQLQYLPPPPAPLELAPQVPAPTETCFYTPGVWQWRGNRFAWRPGFWVEHRPDWVWAPAHYRWTPAGYVFIDGYWDHTLAHRGILFAPVAFRPALRIQPEFVYTPVYVVTDTSLYGSMFVRRGYGNYYFGDYFEPAYARNGYSAWCGVSLRVGNFALNVGRATPVYDPLWSYYSVAYRHEPAWQSGVTDLYAGRYNGDFARPPRTLVQQNTVVNNITNVTNVTNNTTVVNTTVNNVMLTKLTEVRPATQAAALLAVPQADRVREQTAARELRQVAVQRQKLETGIVDRGRTVAKATDAPQSVKLDLPKTAAVRSQAPVTNAPPEAPKPAGSQPTAPKTIPSASQPVPPALPQPVRTKPETKPTPQPPVAPTQPPQLLGPPVVKPPLQPPVPQPQPKPVVTPQPAPITNPLPKPPVPPTFVPPAPIPVPKPPVAPTPAPVVNPMPTPKPPVAPTQPPQLLGPPVVKPPVVVTPQPLPQPKPPAPVVQPQPPPAPRPLPQPAPVFQPPPAPRPQPAPVVQPPPAPRPQPPAPAVVPQPQPPAPPAQPPAPAPKPKDKEKDKKPG